MAKSRPRRGAFRSREASRTHAVDRASGAFGGWRHLTVVDESGKQPRVVARISTVRFATYVFIAAAAMTVYIGHVYRMQDLLNDVQVIRRENVRLHLQHNRLSGEYDAATGPSVIYRRAADLELEEGIAYGEPIRLDPPIEPLTP